jgi:hypothetical protein
MLVDANSSAKIDKVYWLLTYDHKKHCQQLSIQLHSHKTNSDYAPSTSTLKLNGDMNEMLAEF